MGEGAGGHYKNPLAPSSKVLLMIYTGKASYLGITGGIAAYKAAELAGG